MKKLWVRWVALALLVIVLGVVMMRLVQWQLHRLS
ncbi:MAG: SURF1 family protein, partial [Cutibacterium granulosum]|nr:SURF1 family protein [Cutibacterium granulosum]